MWKYVIVPWPIDLNFIIYERDCILEAQMYAALMRFTNFEKFDKSLVNLLLALYHVADGAHVISFPIAQI